MKYTSKIVLGVVLTVAILGVIFYNKQNADSGEVRFLKQFYNSYIPLISEDHLNEDGLEKGDSMMRTYCTGKMQQQFDDKTIDFDLFIDGQYCLDKWLQTLNVSKTKSEGVYKVTFDTKTIRIRVIKAGDAYKIDEVIR